MAAATGPAAGATLTGQVRLVDSAKPSVEKQEDFSGVAVWLTSIPATPLPTLHKHARMLQKDKQFSPHILVIAAGTTVDFPNLDPIFHNAFSNFEGQIFDVSLYPPGSSRPVRFDRPGIVRVFCNIHPSMSAVIVVVNSNHFTSTARRGVFSLGNITPGSYKIHFFHERAKPENLEALTQTVSISENNVSLPVVTISESGYLPVAHKNKYGRDYPPGSDERQYSWPLR